MFGILPEKLHEIDIFDEEVKQRSEDDIVNNVQWISYRETYIQSRHFAAGLLSLFPSRSFIGISGETRYEWYVADYACIFSNFVSVPIHVTFDQTATEYIINSASLVAMITGRSTLPKFIEAVESERCPTLKHIILMEKLNEQEQEIAASLAPKGVRFTSMRSIIQLGQENPADIVAGYPDEIATLMYTSGSTGLPKGTIVYNRSQNKELSSRALFFSPLVVVSYMPLAHAMQRSSSYLCVASGGQSGIFQGEISQLFEFVQRLRPTYFSAVPRVWNLIYSQFKEEYLLETLNAPKSEHPNIEKEVMKRYENILGDRIAAISIGGAPTSQEVLRFLKKCFANVIFSEGYGTTEVGGIASNGMRQAETLIKLKDVPELGYTSKDVPYPRGELWVKNAGMAPGYFKDPVNTASNFDSEGYFNTGDIVAYCPTTEVLRVIDRKKHIFKLAQGEFVAPEWLETIYLQSPYVSSIYIYGDGLWDSVMGVVVPNEHLVIEWARTNGIETEEFAELCKREDVYNLLWSDIVRIGRQSKVQPYEVPRGIILEPVPFSPENGLLTPSFKLNRLGLVAKYKEPLSKLYSSLGASSTTPFQKLIRKQIADVIFKATGVSIEGKEGEETEHASLQSIGVDSLSAIKLASLLKSELSIEVSVGKLLMEEGGINKLLDLLGENPLPSSLSFFSSTKESVDWRKEASLPTEFINLIERNLERTSCPSNENLNILESKSILLTGCTGFLGCFLLRDLLKSSSSPLIYCLVRGVNTKEEAMTKIVDRLKYHLLFSDQKEDSSSLLSFSDLKRVVPVLGDLSKPLLGLNKTEFLQLGEEVDCIVHNGCEVNGVFSYSDLKNSNVGSTKELVTMAARKRMPFVFISSLSSFCGRQGDEETHFISPDDTILQNSVGYGATKYISEILVEKAKSYGLPTIIIRPGTICGNTAEEEKEEEGEKKEEQKKKKTGCCVNTTDFLNKLIATIIQLKIAPEVHTTLEMIPVDFVSRAILYLASRPSSWGNNFHILNSEQTPSVMELWQYIRTYKGMGRGRGDTAPSPSASITQFEEIKTVPYCSWREVVLSNQDCAMYPIRHYLPSFSFPRSSHFADSKTRQELKKSQDETLHTYPTITSETVHQWIDFLLDTKFIDLSQTTKS